MSDVPTFDDLASDLVTESDVNETAVEQQDTTPTESSTEETKSPEVADTTEAAEEEAETDSSDETDGETEELAEEEQPQSKADERKAQLNTEIRDLVTQRRDLMQQVEELNARVYAPQSIDDLTQEVNPETGDYYSRLEARVIANEQRTELAEYNTRVAEAQLVISSESERVLNDFPMFNPDSPEYAPAVAEQAAQLLRQNLQTDPNTGQISGTNIST